MFIVRQLFLWPVNCPFCRWRQMEQKHNNKSEKKQPTTTRNTYNNHSIMHGLCCSQNKHSLYFAMSCRLFLLSLFIEAHTFFPNFSIQSKSMRIFLILYIHSSQQFAKQIVCCLSFHAETSVYLFCFLLFICRAQNSESKGNACFDFQNNNM